MSLLAENRLRQLAGIRSATERTLAAYAERRFPAREEYFLPRFARRIADALGCPVEELDVSWIDRARLGSDIALRLPSRLKESGPKDYVANVVPDLLARLSPLIGTDGIESVASVGIYVNFRISDVRFYASIGIVERLGADYGYSDRDRDETAVVEYSDPNAAKHLHAGHIRSTIIGHIIANLFDRTGYVVHRVNHPNDWGGIGAIMEGYVRWGDELSGRARENNLLYEIYLRYRTGEKLAGKQSAWDEAKPETRFGFSRAYGASAEDDFASFREAFGEFKAAAHERFMRLENGDDAEFSLWEKLIPWSLAEFDSFYELLGIRIDHTIGESFYADTGREIVDAGVAEWGVLFYTEDRARADREAVEAAVATWTLDAKVAEKLREEITRDVGSYVVPLPDFERFVVLKRDRSTIYSTRDLAVVKFRLEEWNPSVMIYEVGQEQADHFAKTFASARLLGLVPAGRDVAFEHVYHGFYVNESGAKLSSRDGASNILALIRAAVEYFRVKYDASDEFSQEEKDRIARALAIGSIIFNDIRKDRKQPVTLGSDTLAIMRQFEEAGGAYVVYASCRAKSILAKAARLGVAATQLPPNTALEAEEIALIKKLHDYPAAIERATDTRNPSVIAEYVRSLAQEYNTYYAKCPVLPDHPYRLSITAAVARVIDCALVTCSITPLERI